MNNKYAAIHYQLDEEGRKDSILKGGDGQDHQIIIAKPDERILKHAKVKYDGSVSLNIGFIGDPDSPYFGIDIDWTYDGDVAKGIKSIHAPAFSKVMTVTELLDWEEKRIEYMEGRESVVRAVYDRDKKVLEQEELKRKRAREEENRIEKEKQMAIEAEYIRKRSKWIEEHGSQYLKDCLELGYETGDQYIIERAHMELPEFMVDTEEKMSWKSIKKPSEKAIDEIKQLMKSGYNAKIVHLTRYYDKKTCKEIADCESILISDYLDGYNLIKVV